MIRMLRAIAAAVILLACASGARGQSVDPSGHWTGVIKAPSAEIAVVIDLARSGAGPFVGAISMPGEALKGLPLQSVAVDGRSVQFYARADQRFTGELSDDGATIAGQLTVPEGSAPLTLVRAGDAQLEPPIRGARIPDALEGEWRATMTADQGEMHLVLTMHNDGDGSSRGELRNHDQGDVRLPLRIVARDRTVTLDSSVYNGSFTGQVSDDGTEIVGTYRQGAFSAPITFHRAAR